jgi:hypothetical protein
VGALQPAEGLEVFGRTHIRQRSGLAPKGICLLALLSGVTDRAIVGSLSGPKVDDGGTNQDHPNLLG